MNPYKLCKTVWQTSKDKIQYLVISVKRLVLWDDNTTVLKATLPIESVVSIKGSFVWFLIKTFSALRNIWRVMLQVCRKTYIGLYKVFITRVRFKASSHIACHAAKGLECVFPIWFTQCGRVWFTLAMPFFSRPRHGRLLTAMLCCSLEKNGMVGAWHGHGDGHGMASVNQTRPHYVN